jgi:hypothetical protein
MACDPREEVLDNKLGEDHVGVNILYCPNNVLEVMTTSKWPLAQTIMDGYSLRQLLVSYDESKIPIVDEKGKFDVRKKEYTFHKRNRSVGHSNCLVLRIEKLS